MRNLPFIIIIKNLRRHIKFLLAILLTAISTFIFITFATPSILKYSPGETSCSSGDTNCTIANQKTSSAYLTDIAGTTANKGDVIYFNGVNWENLKAGTSGQFLKTQGSSANPIWGNISGGSGLLKVNNLSDLTNAEIARSNLGLAINMNVQAWDNNLSNIATLKPINNYLLVGNGTNWVASDTTNWDKDSSNDLTTSLPSANFFLGNNSNVAVAVSMGGDATMSNNGTLSITTNAVALGTDTTGNYVQSLVGGVGLSGGSSAGSEGSTLTLNLDVNGLTAKTAVNNTDTIAVYDASALVVRKMTRANFLAGVTGALTYQGGWNATTNTPSLADSTGSKGNYYVASTAGSENLGSGAISFTVGDWVIHNGSIWEKLDSVNDVQSVFGRTGVITAGSSDYTATQIINASAGNIASTNIQGAINELDLEKQPLDAQLTDVAGLIATNGNFIVGDGINFVSESGSVARTSLGVGTGDSPQFTGLTLTGNGVINAQGDLRLADADSSNYVGFQAPAIVVSNIVWTLPIGDGTNGQVLSTDGTGILNWASDSSGASAINGLSDAQKDVTNNNLFLGQAGFTGTFYNNYNTAIGLYAFDNPNVDSTNTNFGDSNTAVGYNALTGNTTGYQNSAEGAYALYSNTLGNNNIGYGYNAGRYIANGTMANTSSTNSLYLGANTKALASGDTNEIVIGDNAIGIGSNTAVLGNDSIITTALKGKVGIGTTTPAQKLEVVGTDTKIVASGSLGASIQLKQTTSSTWSEWQQTGDRTRLNTLTGTDLLTVLNTGNVGIGTTTPTSKFQVNVTTFGNGYKLSQGGVVTSLWTTNGLGSNYDTIFGSVTNNALRLFTYNTEKMVILASGKVGIGVTAPGTKLQVNGGVRVLGGSTFNGDVGYSFSGGLGDTDGGMFSPADGTLTFATNNVERVRLDSSGRVGIGAIPTIKLAIGDSDTGINWASDGVLDVYSNNVVVARIDGNGISSDKFAGRLKRVSDNAYVVPGDGSEYYSPDQQGGKYGTVYRMYIGTTSFWVNGYNFVNIGANGTLINSAIQVLNIANSEEEVITDVSYSDIYRARVVKSIVSNNLILHVGIGYTLLGGWVDYSK